MKNFTSTRSTKDGNFAQISNDILFDTRLQDGSKLLLTILLNNNETWEIKLGFYTKKLGWTSKKMAAIIKNLCDCGYLIKFKERNKKGTFDYTYQLDEYGKLNSPQPKTVSTPPPVVRTPVVPAMVKTPQPSNVSLPDEPSKVVIPSVEPNKMIDELFSDYSHHIDDKLKNDVLSTCLTYRDKKPYIINELKQLITYQANPDIIRDRISSIQKFN